MIALQRALIVANAVTLAAAGCAATPLPKADPLTAATTSPPAMGRIVDLCEVATLEAPTDRITVLGVPAGRPMMLRDLRGRDCALRVESDPLAETMRAACAANAPVHVTGRLWVDRPLTLDARSDRSIQVEAYRCR